LAHLKKVSQLCKFPRITENATLIFPTWISIQEMTLQNVQTLTFRSWACTSAVKCLPSMYQALSSIPSTAMNKQTNKQQKTFHI
jgi:hypothetical protein